MNLARAAAALLSCAAMAISSGCLALAAATAAGVGTYAYVKGDLETAYEASLDATYDAALAALEELQYPVKQSGKDSSMARIAAEEADGTDIKLTLERASERVTNGSVRIGVFGNEPKSRLILDKMRERLRGGV
jgi:hypothetical protein